MLIKFNNRNKEWIDEMYCPVCGNLAFQGVNIAIHKSSTIKVVKDKNEKHNLNIECKKCGTRLGIDLGQPTTRKDPLYSNTIFGGRVNA